MNTMIQALGNATYTMNGMPAYKSTLSYNLDFFGSVDRFTSENDALQLFNACVQEDVETAMMNLVFLRMIKKGKGTRHIFRYIYSWLVNKYPNTAEVMYKYTTSVDFRPDDFLSALNSPLREKYARYIRHLLYIENNANVAKWMPSVQTKNPLKREYMIKLVSSAFQGRERKYRKILSELRSKLNLVETNLTNKTYNKIEYSHVPSKAMTRYMKKFLSVDEERFQEYLNKIESGESKMNASVSNPSDIIREFFNKVDDYEYNDNLVKALNIQWDSMDYSGIDTNLNTIVMSDVSASMMDKNGLPMYISIGLGIKASELLKGDFKDKLITFTDKPSFIDFSDLDNVYDKYRRVLDQGVGYNTDICKAIDLIYQTTLKVRPKKEDQINRLVIVSDMEFDNNSNIRYDNNLIEHYKNLYKENDIEFPEIIFWNVDANKFHISKSEKGVAIISGDSKGIFNAVLSENEIGDPQKFMIDTFYNTFKDDEIMDKILDTIME